VSLWSRHRYSLECGHRVCNGCWAAGLGAYVGEGTEALRTRCFMTGCGLVVPPSGFARFLDAEGQAKYDRWAAKAFVACSPMLRDCPKATCKVNAPEATFCVWDQ